VRAALNLKGVEKMKKPFTVLYRIGRTGNAKWRRCPPVSTLNEANKQKADIERMGYKTLVHVAARLDAVGMTKWWAA